MKSLTSAAPVRGASLGEYALLLFAVLIVGALGFKALGNPVTQNADDARAWLEGDGPIRGSRGGPGAAGGSVSGGGGSGAGGSQAGGGFGNAGGGSNGPGSVDSTGGSFGGGSQGGGGFGGGGSQAGGGFGGWGSGNGSYGSDGYGSNGSFGSGMGTPSNFVSPSGVLETASKGVSKTNDEGSEAPKGANETISRNGDSSEKPADWQERAKDIAVGTAEIALGTVPGWGVVEAGYGVWKGENTAKDLIQAAVEEALSKTYGRGVAIYETGKAVRDYANGTGSAADIAVNAVGIVGGGKAGDAAKHMAEKSGKAKKGAGGGKDKNGPEKSLADRAARRREVMEAAEAGKLKTVPLQPDAVDGPNVKRLSRAELEEHKLHVGKDGKLYDSEGELFDTRDVWRGSSGRGKTIFVMDEHGNLYSTYFPEDGQFHHSSFNTQVAGAGEIEVRDGVVKNVNFNDSGHYKPSREIAEQTELVMEGKGVDLSQARREMVDPSGNTMPMGQTSKRAVSDERESSQTEAIKQELKEETIGRVTRNAIYDGTRVAIQAANEPNPTDWSTERSGLLMTKDFTPVDRERNQAIFVPQATKKALVDAAVGDTNKLHKALPEIVPLAKVTSEGKIEQFGVRGYSWTQINSSAHKRAEQQIKDVSSKATAVLGDGERATGDGWVRKVDASPDAFLYDLNGNVTAWVHPIQVKPAHSSNPFDGKH